jgi:membrane protease YdiL (CAAX protease family)
METVVAVRKPFDYRRLSAMFGVIIALFWPFLFIYASHDLTDIRVIVRSILADWGVALLLALIAFGTLRRRASWFGIGMFGWRDVLAMLAVLAGLFLLGGAVRWYFSMPSSPEYLRKMGAIPLSLRALLVLTAGITEEFMYRGFALEELAALIGKRRLAALVSMVCFTAAHSARVGLSPTLLLVGCAGAVLTILYLWRRNLPVCMLMHVIVDGIGILVVPAVYRAYGG